MKINGNIEIGNTAKTFDDIVNSTITERGNNSNGSWIKFSSGIMICWKNLTTSTNINSTYGNSNMYSGTINLGNLPQVFVETPFMDFNNNGIPFAIPTYNGASASSWGNVRILYTTQLLNYTVNIRAFAIGYWK